MPPEREHARERENPRQGPPREKRERPRDELGRPLPWDARNLLEMEDYESLPLEENHRLAREHFNAGRFFPAHEAWEAAWKQRKDSDEAEFFKGLSQLGAGYVHLHRGNPHGAKTLMRRAARRIAAYPPGHREVDTRAVAEAAAAHADAVEAGRVREPADLRPPWV